MEHRFWGWALFFCSCTLFLVAASTRFKTNEPNEVKFSYLKYDVEVQDKNVGWMTCAKTPSTSDPTITNYVIDSKVVFNIVTSYTIQFNLSSSYKHNDLYKSNYATKVNGDTQSFSTVNWDGSRYMGWDGTNNNVITSDKITQSIANLYYKEPVGLTQLFSEKFMAMCPIVKTGDYYYVTFPDGKTTTYKYQNGICVWAESKQKLYRIVFRLKEIK
ncbi:DUF6134 family protein [Cytophaga aurantiaca]|uniref:DUF6134 family protein n=1 Tax=Cytophaga aurantiaca TaxID=29530 RepID=UPI0003711F13|nr:DUF6134 family protein [Cytophaga aurantiaca]